MTRQVFEKTTKLKETEYKERESRWSKWSMERQKNERRRSFFKRSKSWVSGLGESRAYSVPASPSSSVRRKSYEVTTEEKGTDWIEKTNYEREFPVIKRSQSASSFPKEQLLAPALPLLTLTPERRKKYKVIEGTERIEKAKYEREISVFKRSRSASPFSREQRRTPASPPLKSSPLTGSQRHRSPSAASTVAWDISEKVITALAGVARCAPTPYIGSLAGIALDIFTAVQEAKRNKDALKQLARQIYELITAVLQTCKDLHSQSTDCLADSTLVGHLEELISTLININDFIKNQTSHHLLRRFVASKSDWGMIQDYKDELSHVLNAFSLRASITLQVTMSKVASQQAAMLRSQELFCSLLQDILSLGQQQPHAREEAQVVTEYIPTLLESLPTNFSPKMRTISFATFPAQSIYEQDFGVRVDSPIADAAASQPPDSGPSSSQSNKSCLPPGLSYAPPLSQVQLAPKPLESNNDMSCHISTLNASIQGVNISVNPFVGTLSNIPNTVNSRLKFDSDNARKGNGGHTRSKHGGHIYGNGKMDILGSGNLKNALHRSKAPRSYIDERRGRWQGYHGHRSAQKLKLQGKSLTVSGSEMRAYPQYGPEPDCDIVGERDSYRDSHNQTSDAYALPDPAQMVKGIRNKMYRRASPPEEDFSGDSDLDSPPSSSSILLRASPSLVSRPIFQNNSLPPSSSQPIKPSSLDDSPLYQAFANDIYHNIPTSEVVGYSLKCRSVDKEHPGGRRTAFRALSPDRGGPFGALRFMSNRLRELSEEYFQLHDPYDILFLLAMILITSTLSKVHLGLPSAKSLLAIVIFVGFVSFIVGLTYEQLVF